MPICNMINASQLDNTTYNSFPFSQFRWNSCSAGEIPRHESLFYWHIPMAAAGVNSCLKCHVCVTLLFQHILSQMKAVAGMKMSYNLQQAIDSSRKTIIRGFRQDETHSALCSHLFTMIRGNRQHRRAFLISLLNLFDDSAVSKPALILTHLGAAQCKVVFSHELHAK